MVTRQPVVAGRFYPGDADELRRTIGRLVDPEAVPGDVVGALVPHAGYEYSGAVAGATISRIACKETFVIIGPNHTGRGAPYSVSTGGKWRTPLGEVAVDSELAERIVALSNCLEADEDAHREEHSVEVEIPFLQYFKPDVRIVPIVLASAEVDLCREIGRAIAGAVKETGREVVILASGDMTHYEPLASAEKKDRVAIEAILAMDEGLLLRRGRDMDITMCAGSPAAIMIAACRELGGGNPELVRYATSGDVTGDYTAVVGYAGILVPRQGLSPLVQLAKQAVEGYVRERRRFQPESLTPAMEAVAGVFVSIHKHHHLRGCIGTFEAAEANIAEEIISNAISSSTRDPRFSPVTPGELDELEYNVDVLTTPEPVSGVDQLDATRYGVIVQAGGRRGLLLPDLEGVDSVARQIDICRQKAGIRADETVTLYRFEVVRHR